MRALIIFAIGAVAGLVGSELAKLAGGGPVLRVGCAFLSGLLIAAVVLPRLPK